MGDEQRQEHEQAWDALFEDLFEDRLTKHEQSLLEQAKNKWGVPISEERQRELQQMLDAWNAPDADHGERRGPLDGVLLTGADICWLAEQVRDRYGSVYTLHLEGANLFGAHLEGANLVLAQLQGAVLSKAQLPGVKLGSAHLEGINLSEAQLPGANLSQAHLEGAKLQRAHLEGANLRFTQLQGAVLSDAQLQGADLGFAQLQGAVLLKAQLQGANLRVATLDGNTTLVDAVILAPDDTRPWLARLLRRPHYGPALGDLHWGDFDLVQLTQLVGWEDLRRLADERGLNWRSKAADHSRAVRAYRQVAQRLRDQGFSDIADRLADRAQVLQRKLLFRLMLEDWSRPWRLPGDLVRWLFSWFLALLAGYGYHPGRSVFWYLATIAGFAYLYFQATHGFPIGPFHFTQASDIQALQPNEALILSVSSFHGRGFFQPVKSLGDPVAGLAALEAVIGLLIEISFIATFTQRFFSAK